MNAGPHPSLHRRQQQGLDALRQGDAAAARRHFEAALALGQDDASTQLGLAHALLALGDHAGASAALDRTLVHEPRHLRALLMKAQLLDTGGDLRAAVAYWSAALNLVPPPRDALPPDMQRALAEAEARRAQAARRFEAALRENLARHRPPGQPSSARFERSIDMLTGRAQRHVSQPQVYFFPDLPDVPFHDRAAFPWLAELEAATPVIREELLGVLGDPQAFVPYLQRDGSRPVLGGSELLDSTDWSAYFLWKDGAPVAAHLARCPRTAALLQGLPLTDVPGRMPNALFSLLRPGARIPPHTGYVNTRLIVHLPLIVPPGCVFRVGDVERRWEEGRAWVFDDTIEHEASNASDRTRVILLFEVWRPELTDAERAQVRALFAAIGTGENWGI